MFYQQIAAEKDNVFVEVVQHLFLQGKEELKESTEMERILQDGGSERDAPSPPQCRGHIPTVMRLLEALVTGTPRDVCCKFQCLFRQQEGRQHSIDLLFELLGMLEYANEYVTKLWRPRIVEGTGDVLNSTSEVVVALEWVHHGLEAQEMIIRGNKAQIVT